MASVSDVANVALGDVTEAAALEVSSGRLDRTEAVENDVCVTGSEAELVAKAAELAADVGEAVELADAAVTATDSVVTASDR